LCGCQSSKPGRATSDTGISDIRENSYALLHQLLSDEKDVSKLRFIKREPSDLKDLVNRIAKASGDGAKLLETFAKEDDPPNLDNVRLPPGEVATRDAIASTKKKQLLGNKGDEFELALLLTQLEALNYASHLAKVAAAHEPRPDRAKALTGLSDEMNGY